LLIARIIALPPAAGPAEHDKLSYFDILNQRSQIIRNPI